LFAVDCAIAAKTERAGNSSLKKLKEGHYLQFAGRVASLRRIVEGLISNGIASLKIPETIYFLSILPWII